MGFSVCTVIRSMVARSENNKCFLIHYKVKGYFRRTRHNTAVRCTVDKGNVRSKIFAKELISLFAKGYTVCLLWSEEISGQ